MKPYMVMYRRWIGAPGVGAAEIAVLSGLYARADVDGVCADLVQEELAAELGKSRPWLCAVLATLQKPEVALVETRRKRGFRGMVYALAGVGAADSSGRSVDGMCQPADGLLRTGNLLNPDSQNSSSRRAGESDPLNEDWQPTAEDLVWATETRPEVEPAAVTRKFVTWCRKAHARNGYRPADPSAAWRKWVARELVAPAETPAPVTPDTADTARLPAAERRPSNRSDQNDRRHRSFSKSSGSDQRGGALASRNADVLAALRDRLARPA
ncbi:hypothetical protein [Azospirillum sp. sgz302134]